MGFDKGIKQLIYHAPRNVSRGARRVSARNRRWSCSFSPIAACLNTAFLYGHIYSPGEATLGAQHGKSRHPICIAFRHKKWLSLRKEKGSEDYMGKAIIHENGFVCYVVSFTALGSKTSNIVRNSPLEVEDKSQHCLFTWWENKSLSSKRYQDIYKFEAILSVYLLLFLPNF